MTLPCYQYDIIVHERDVLPRGPLDGGTAGDHGAVRLRFMFDDSDAGDYRYRVEVVNGAGAYDTTEPLAVTDGAITVDVPDLWTAAGTAVIRLVQLSVTDGEETARRHYAPIRIRFAYREEGNGTAVAAPLWQTMLTRAEKVLTEAEKAASDAALSAKTAADNASRAAEAAESATGVLQEKADAAMSLASDAEARTAGLQVSIDGLRSDIDEVKDRANGIAEDVQNVKNEAEEATTVSILASQQASAAFEYIETLRQEVSLATTHAINADMKATDADRKADEASENIESLRQDVEDVRNYAIEAGRNAESALNSAITAERKADDALSMIGDIETALDAILDIQNNLIGGDGV